MRPGCWVFSNNSPSYILRQNFSLAHRAPQLPSLGACLIGYPCVYLPWFYLGHLSICCPTSSPPSSRWFCLQSRLFYPQDIHLWRGLYSATVETKLQLIYWFTWLLSSRLQATYISTPTFPLPFWTDVYILVLEILEDGSQNGQNISVTGSWKFCTEFKNP